MSTKAPKRAKQKESRKKTVFATAVVNAFSTERRHRSKYAATGSGVRAPRAMRSGNAVAHLMQALFTGTAINPTQAGSLELAKAQLMVEHVRGRFPQDEGWQIEAEKTIRATVIDNTELGARCDVFVTRTNMDTGATEIYIVEAKTTLDLQGYVSTTYKKRFHTAKPSKYENHQRQLAVGIQVARKVYPDATVSGSILLCGGNAHENMFVRWHDMNDNWDNKSFLCGIAADESSIMAELNQHRAMVSDQQVLEKLQIPISRLVRIHMDQVSAPIMCAVGLDGSIHGVYAFRYTKNKQDAQRAITFKSPCAEQVVLFVRD